jgi:cell division protein FtsL
MTRRLKEPACTKTESFGTNLNPAYYPAKKNSAKSAEQTGSENSVIAQKSNLNITKMENDLTNVVVAILFLLSFIFEACYLYKVETRLNRDLEEYKAEVTQQMKTLENIMVELAN